MKTPLLLLCLCLSFLGLAQTPESNHKDNDSIRKAELIRYIGNGYYPTPYFDFDLRYLIKYNQYEGFRTGLGGVTNQNFSKRFKIEGYGVYGFLDHRFKYSIGGAYNLFPKTNTWLSLSYTEDLEETGSSTFLTDKRFFTFFEPRLINIELFHKHISKTVALGHQISPRVLAETQFSVRKIEPTYAYSFRAKNGEIYNNYDLSLGTISVQWSPFSKFESDKNGLRETKNGYPKFTLQYTKSFKGAFEGDFSFSKIDFRTIQQFNYGNNSLTRIVFTGGIASGDTPLTHLYHAYPNNVNKETILQRFSVAGTTSFETMYFNEFFSDKFATLILKHQLKPFKISPWFQPQLVLVTKHAIGDMDSLNKHQQVSFNTLEKGYSESGIEINKLFLGFGLSFAYRYGAYHLPQFEDNFAFKFTFNISLDN